MRIPGGLRPKKAADAAVWAVLAAAVLVWVVLLLQNLGYLSLWMDEGFHYLAAEGSLKHGYPLFPSGHVYFKAILYTYVLALLSLIFGLGAETLRVVSVLCTAGLILLVWHVGRRFFDRTVGILAAAVFALSVWGVEYARLALYFAPLMLFYLLGLYFFYRGFFEDVRTFKILATVFFLLTPQIHQLGQGVVFAYLALFLIRGAKRFFKKDVLWSAALVGLASVGLQLHEYFFWKVGYVYFKDDQSLGGMVRYFFGGFSLDYFKEFFRSFPWMSLAVLAGVFLNLGAFLRRRDPSPDGAAAAEPGPSGAGSTPWLYLNLCFISP
ncbi:MAG: glycosyltransferase family 39 protein, partial [Candidatus Aminicenantes bacterium]|nr:glycosyltransferase family 39 protein [Candidatus Aminicenantes bacterium]